MTANLNDPTEIARLDAIADKLENLSNTVPDTRGDKTKAAILKRIYDAIGAGAFEAHILNAHTDVTVGFPLDGDFLRYDAGLEVWVASTTALPDMTDVNDTAVPTSGHFLKGDGTEWSNSVINLPDLDDIDSTISPTIEGTVLYWDGVSEWTIKAPNTWSNDYTSLADHDDVFISLPNTDKVLIGSAGAWSTILYKLYALKDTDDISILAASGDELLQYKSGSSTWEAVNPTTAIKAEGFIHQDGTIPLTANWNAGDFEITAQKLIADNDQNDTSYDNFLIQTSVTETGSVVGRVYRGAFIDIDFDYNNAAGLDTSIIRGIDIDIDLTSNAVFSSAKPQILKAIITGDATQAFGTIVGDQPFYVLVENSRIAQGFSQGASYFGLDMGGSTQQCISTRSYVTGTGSGRKIGYQGYAEANGAGATGELNALYGFLNLAGGGAPARAVAVLGDGTNAVALSNDKLMSFKGINGHMLLSSGSLFVRGTSANDPSAFSSTHLTHNSFNGDIYAQGALEVDGIAYFDGDITIADAKNIILNTTTGTKIGTTTSQKMGFFNAAPVAQQTGCAVPTDLATCITAITVLRTALNNLGFTTVV
jgi:hypothetical protein